MERSKEAYPLQQLMRLRKELRDRRQGLLAEAISAAEEIARRLQTLTQAIAAQEATLSRHAADQARLELRSAHHLGELGRYIRRLRSELSAKKDELGRTRDHQRKEATVVDEAREALIKAERDLKLVESNRERWDDERRRMAERLAEEELDGLVSARGNLAKEPLSR